MSLQCIGTPISWIELERYALHESSCRSAVLDHLKSCLACTDAIHRIEVDHRDMPALPAVALRTPSKAWLSNWQWGLALVSVVAILFLLRSSNEEQVLRHHLGMKGGDSSIILIREHSGIFLDSSFFADGDRFKVQLSCGQGSRYVDIVVEQDGQLYYPLDATKVECANQVMLPGAFSLDGGGAQICAVFGQTQPPVRQSLPADALCVGIVPES